MGNCLREGTLNILETSFFSKESGVLFVLGIIATILLVIFQETGVLKGGRWLWLLVAAAILTIPLAISNPWVVNAPYLWKFWRGGLLVAIIVFGYSGLGIRLLQAQEPEVSVSPSAMTLDSPMVKRFTLSITNSLDVGVYNVGLGICFDSRVRDFSSLLTNFDAVEKEKEFQPGIPVAMFRIGLKNGCMGIVFGEIGPHETKKFNVAVDGSKVPLKTEVRFRVYNWYKEPFFESVQTDRDFVTQGLPDKFGDLLGATKGTGNAYRMKIRLPANPFFNEEDDPKEYWIVAVTNF